MGWNAAECGGMTGIGGNVALVGVRSPWPLLTTYSSTDTAESSTSVQQYSSTAVQHQQDSSTAALSHDTRRAVVGGFIGGGMGCRKPPAFGLAALYRVPARQIGLRPQAALIIPSDRSLGPKPKA